MGAHPVCSYPENDGGCGAHKKILPGKKSTCIKKINFWSGCRTVPRRDYERAILKSVLQATKEEYGDWELIENTKDYHGVTESRTFREFGHDVFVTIAGNRKMDDERKIVVYKPILNGLLGYRAIIIRKEDKGIFAEIHCEKKLKQKQIGIPETWFDAELFRYNGFSVVERGTYDDMLQRLKNREFDYTALGINEIERVFDEKVDEVDGLDLVEHLMIYYPLPLLFYVNPNAPELAERIDRGMSIISENKMMDRIYYIYNRHALKNLNLGKRTIIRLKNPILPKEIAGLACELPG